MHMEANHAEDHIIVRFVFFSRRYYIYNIYLNRIINYNIYSVTLSYFIYIEFFVHFRFLHETISVREQHIPLNYLHIALYFFVNILLILELVQRLHI